MDERAGVDRQALIERLGELRREGAIDAAEQESLLRHFDDMQRDLRDEIVRLQPEYMQRARTDGKDAADRWLTETAETLGRRFGEATRDLTDRLRVVTGAPAA